MSSRPQHGEGQALALREGAAFFHRSAGPSDATRASKRVSPRRGEIYETSSINRVYLSHTALS